MKYIKKTNESGPYVYLNYNGLISYPKFSGGLPNNIIGEDDGLYLIKGTDVYPVSHPDLSTLPSILPLRFGKEKIYEMLYHPVVNLSTVVLNEDVNALYSLDYSTYKDFLNNSIPNLEPNWSSTSLNEHMKIYFSSTHSSAYVGYEVSGGMVQFTDFPNFDHTLRVGLKFSNTTVIIPMGSPQESMNFFQYFTIVELDSITENHPIASYGIYKIENGQIISCTLEDLERLEGYGYTFTNQFVIDIPSTATIIEASSFNSNICVPAICKKENGKWTITNNENITPDFILVRYIGEIENYYYENNSSSPDSSPIIIKSFDIPMGTGTSEWPNQMNVFEIWGDESLMFGIGQIIGKVIVNTNAGSNEKSDLIVVSTGSSSYVSVGAPSVDDTRILRLDLNRTAGISPHVATAPPYDIHIDFYAL